MLADLSEVLKLSQKIRQDTKGELDKAQREYILREQLRAIRRELGEDDEGGESELLELREKLAALALPDATSTVARRELKRLERMPEQSAEYPMLRTWCEVFVELPWNTTSEAGIDLARARRILDEDHYGLESVKKRILEVLAVRKLNPTGQGSTLCLVGPPGVGKTSLGRSVARAMGREFARTSLGGVHDEAEIRGHRRTYVGALPGAILNGIRKAGTRDPVFVLDEMDKLGAGLHGDPGAALLEVLDPAQNDTFEDNYLGVPFDLSRVFFIGTANVLESIPGPLRDRLEVIELPGYTEEEKLEIAKRYLVRRQLASCGLKAGQCRIGVRALKELVRYYTREAGVRQLEREIGALCRHAATLFAGRRRKPWSVGLPEVAAVLGPRTYEHEVAARTSMPGVATGLAWTPVGGEILFVEASSMPGKGALTLTGQLGDVMRESAQAAVSIVRARAAALGLDAAYFETHDLHLHIPAGAVPKDGPSAGVALFTALVSLLTARRVRASVAMTGELSLRGLVLPVGGIKEKVLAAQAAGVRTVLLPARNEHDLRDVPESARAKLEFVFLETVDDALAAALAQG
jgi:ATP-dependent Lon protease